MHQCFLRPDRPTPARNAENRARSAEKTPSRKVRAEMFSPRCSSEPETLLPSPTVRSETCSSFSRGCFSEIRTTCPAQKKRLGAGCFASGDQTQSIPSLPPSQRLVHSLVLLDPAPAAEARLACLWLPHGPAHPSSPPPYDRLPRSSLPPSPRPPADTKRGLPRSKDPRGHCHPLLRLPFLLP